MPDSTPLINWALRNSIGRNEENVWSLPPPKRRQCLAALALIGTCAVISSSIPASAQTPSNRQVAVLDAHVNATHLLNEPAAAASADIVLEVHIECGPEATGPKRFIGYSYRKNSGGGWVQGHLAHPTGSTDEFDPSVAYDPTTGKFLVVAQSIELGIVTAVATYNGTALTFTGGDTNAWTRTYVNPTAKLDKPWVIRGDASGEFYITFAMGATDPPVEGYGIVRTQNSGASWYPTWTETTQPIADTLIKVDTQFPGSGFAIQPTLGRDGKIYAAHATTEGLEPKIRFLIGTDSGSGVTWYYMRTLVQETPTGPLEPKPAFIKLIRGDLSAPTISWCPALKPAKQIPWLAADPTADRLFLVYQDVDGIVREQYEDTNIYLRVITQVSGSTWEVSEAIQVNQDQLPNGLSNPENDQILPTVTVDAAGRLHVIWQDDREHNSNFPCGGCQSRWDTFYARITNFSNPTPTIAEYRLCDVQGNCGAADASLTWGPPFFVDDTFRPGEYSGLTTWTSGSTTTVWAIWAGSRAETTGAQPSLLWWASVP